MPVFEWEEVVKAVPSGMVGILFLAVELRPFACRSFWGFRRFIFEAAGTLIGSAWVREAPGPLAPEIKSSAGSTAICRRALSR